MLFSQVYISILQQIKHEISTISQKYDLPVINIYMSPSEPNEYVITDTVKIVVEISAIPDDVFFFRHKLTKAIETLNAQVSLWEQNFLQHYCQLYIVSKAN